MFYGQARSYFNRPGPFLERINDLKHEVEQDKFRHQLTKFEFEDFRQHTATLLPAAIKQKGPGEKSYPLRTLASVTQKSDGSNFTVLKAKRTFEKGKDAFRRKSFESALGFFEEVVEEHPYSAHVLEALFLQVESNFQLRKYAQASRVLDKMVEAYPAHELTGYAMLRVGKIYEFQDRHDDAIRIYETVLKSFPDRNLSSVARESLRSVEL